MSRLLCWMILSILLSAGVIAAHAEEDAHLITSGESEARIVEPEKPDEVPEAETSGLVSTSPPRVEAASPPLGLDRESKTPGLVPIPPPRDESWKNGAAAFSNYKYEQAVYCFMESPSPLAKYYLAKIYFGDIFVNNIEGIPLPEINRQKAMDVLDTIINYKESLELKNKYTSLMNSPESLSRFYYERGNYEQAEKTIEQVQGKEAEEIRQRYHLYSQSLKSPAPAGKEEVVFSEKPELKLKPEKAAPQDEQQEIAFVEEKGNGHESFSEAACFMDGHQQQISDEQDEMIRVDTREHQPPESDTTESVSNTPPSEGLTSRPSGGRTPLQSNTPLSEALLPRKGSVLVSIKPAVVWDWPALPGYDYKPVARIATETRMVLLDDIATKWYYKVELPDSKVGYICTYLVKRIDNDEPQKTVHKTETIEECTEYINYLVDKHEEEKQAVSKPSPQVKKKPQTVKKSPARKQSTKSTGTQTVKPQEQTEVIFVNESPVQHQSSPSSSSNKSTGGEKHW